MTRLNSQELDLIQNADILRAKNSALNKLFDHLNETLNRLKEVAQNYSDIIPGKALEFHGKVSRGENHFGLPYQVLDYPATFSLNDVFAYRTMFWWGNFYSCTLHLQGKYLNHFENTLLDNFSQMQESGIYISCGESPWNYDYSDSNYNKASEMSLLEMESRDFIKLSVPFELTTIDKLDDNCLGSFQAFMRFLSQ